MASGLHVCEIIVFDDRVGCTDDNNSDRPLAVRRSFFVRVLGLGLDRISVASQVAISRRVQRYKLSRRGRQQEEQTSVEHINTNGLGLEC